MTRRRPADDEFVMPSFRLDGQVVLVTGGSRGLGLGMAMALAHFGADVVLAARSRDRLDPAAALVGRFGGRVLALEADVADVASVRQLVNRSAEEMGRLDVLVNAAGINYRRPADTYTEADWDSLMAINLKGAFFAAQEAARVMRRQGGGRIISVGSLTFEFAVPNVSLYAMSKGGLRQMTRSLAVEWAKDNIAVNAIAPGRFWTEMTDAVFSVPESYENAVSVIPMGRPGVPADLAGATVLLASPAGAYITGQTIVVDGGWLVSSGVKG